MARVMAWFAAASRKFLSASMDRLGLVVLLRLSAGALGVVIDGNRGERPSGGTSQLLGFTAPWQEAFKSKVTLHGAACLGQRSKSCKKKVAVNSCLIPEEESTKEVDRLYHACLIFDSLDNNGLTHRQQLVREMTSHGASSKEVRCEVVV